MALFYSINPVVNNPVLVKDRDINLLTFTSDIPKVLENGINLTGSQDFPIINPGASETHLLGGGFSNLVVQPCFVSKRSKNRGSYFVSVWLTGVGTEYFIEVAPQGEFTTVSLFSTFNVDRIVVANLTEDGISCKLMYGQGSMITPPASSSSTLVTNFKDLVNEIIANNAIQDQATIDPTSKRIVGPTLSP